MDESCMTGQSVPGGCRVRVVARALDLLEVQQRSRKTRYPIGHYAAHAQLLESTEFEDLVGVIRRHLALRQLPPGMCELAALEELSVSRNELQELPEGFDEIITLRCAVVGIVPPAGLKLD